MNATDRSGRLKPISPKCFIQVGSTPPIYFNNLPDLSDSKGANYESTPVIGRATPIVAYANSEIRNISCSINLFVQDQSDCKKNLAILRTLQSAVYPMKGEFGVPFFPPPLCKIQCGSLLSEKPICCIMKECSVKFPTDVPWDAETLCPYRLEISMTLEQVFASQNLPNSNLILSDIPLAA